MSRRLDRITDWETRAARCGYSVHGLAQNCGVSERELRWFFRDKRGVSPKHYLDVLRAQAVLERVARGELVKTASVETNFKQASHCSNFVKRVTGSSPTQRANG